MTKNEKVDLTITIVLICIYSVVVLYISNNYSGPERWGWIALYLVLVFVIGRLINYVLALMGVID